LKIKLGNHAQFLEACDAFMKLGYHWDSNVPCTAPYLYSYSDGRILADFFDVEGADLSSPNSADGYFNAHEHKEITLDELKIMAYGNSVQMTSEQQIEQEIQDKGLNAPRLTPEHIDSIIESQHYFTAADGAANADNSYDPLVGTPSVLYTLTFCVLVLKNGFTVTGESACASPENFDAEIGRKIAYDNARNKIWALEGYLLKERLHQGVYGIAIDPKPPIQIQGLGELQLEDHRVPLVDMQDGELPVPTAVNCGESSGSVGEAKSCLGSASYGNSNHRTIELLLEILRGTNVGGDVTDKARAKLSELVDTI
jgi:hypothetical protein